MKILIVSDTHGREYTLEKALKKTGPIDQLIHLGDVEGGEERIRMLAGNAPAAIIAGNNDFFVTFRMKECLRWKDIESG